MRIIGAFKRFRDFTLKFSIQEQDLGEKIVTGFLFLAGVSFLIVYLAGGYQFTFWSIQVTAGTISNPLILVLALTIIKIGLFWKRQGMTTRDRLQSPILLFLGVLLIFHVNDGVRATGDSIPARYLPVSLLQDFDFDFDEFPFLYKNDMPYFLAHRGDHIVSTYPVWPKNSSSLAVPKKLMYFTADDFIEGTTERCREKIFPSGKLFHLKIICWAALYRQ